MNESLGRCVDRIAGPRLPVLCPPSQRMTICAVEELEAALDELPASRIMHTIVLVDLTCEVDRQWTVEFTSQHVLRPVELLLRYPEVYWIFVVDERAAGDLQNRFGSAYQYHFIAASAFSERVADLLRRHLDGFRPWFDPTGLRRLVRDGAAPAAFGAAVDEETTFATFSGYTLYRSGLPTFLVTSYSELIAVGGLLKEAERPWYVLEDVELNFDDVVERTFHRTAALGWIGKTGDPTIAKVLEARTEEYALFASAKRRVIVSSQAIEESDCVAGNIDKKAVQKPYPGMFAIPSMNGTGAVVEPSRRQSVRNDPRRHSHHHAAPYWAQRVAESLVHRALSLQDEANDLAGAIHVALLAFEARTVLARKNITLSLQALAIQHRMEVTAECAFVGTTGELDVARRLEDLEDTIDDILSEPYLPQLQKATAMAEIVSGLRRTYSDFGRFTEERLCMRSFRAFARRARYYIPPPLTLTRTLRSLPRQVGRLLQWYFDTIIGGFHRLVFAVTMIVLGFAAIFYAIAQPSCARCSFATMSGTVIIQSALTFFALQSGIASDVHVPGMDVGLNGPHAFFLFWTITLVEMMLGFVHLGLLISYLYEKLSQR